MSRAIRTLLAAAFALLALPLEATAQIPPPAGQNNVFLFAQEVSGGGEELVVCLPEFAAQTSIPLTGPVARTLYRRGLATPSEPEVLVLFDALGGGPYAALPVQVGPNAHAVDIFDFRAGFPTAPSVLALGDGPLPYDLFAEPGSGRVWVCELFGIANGRMRIYSITLDGVGAPTRSAALVLPQGPSPYATRIVFDPLTGNLAVPLLNGVALIDPSAGSLVSFVRTPIVPGTQQPFVVGTNLSNDFLGATPASNLLCGLRSPLPNPPVGAAAATDAAGALSMNGRGNNVRQVLFTGQNGLTALSLGFHEIAMSPSGNDTLATFVGFSNIAGIVFPAAPNIGQAWQIDASSFTVGTTQIGVATPIGNPEARRGAPGGPVCSLAVAGAGFVFTALVLLSFDTSVLPAPGNTTGLAFLLGPNAAPSFTLNSTDRPLSLPGSDTWMVPTRPIGPAAFSSALVTLAQNPANGTWNPPPGPGSTAFYAQGLAPVTRPNVLSGTLPASYPPVVPVGFQSMGTAAPGPPPTGYLTSAPPLAPAATATPFANAVPAVTIGGPFLLGTGAYTPNVGPVPATFGARVPVFNFALAQPFASAPWLAVPINPLGGPGMIVEFYSLVNANTGFAYGVGSSSGFITTEIAAY